MITRDEVTKLRSFFLRKDGKNIAQGEITPDITDTHDLGRSAQRWDTIYAKAVVADTLAGAPSGAHSGLAGLDADDHLQYVHISNSRTITAQHSFSPGTTTAPFVLGANAQGQVVTGFLADHVSKEITAGLGLTGGGLLTTGTGVTLTVSLGTGLVFNGDNIELSWSGNPTSIAAGDNVQPGTSLYASHTDHQHEVVASSNPSTTEALLQTDSSGYLQLVRLGIAIAPTKPLHVKGLGDQLRIEYDGGNYADITVNVGGNLIVSPTGDFVFDLAGTEILPQTGYDLNIGSLQKKYLTLHAAELWVETLVAQDTMATIGGRVLVGPTTVFEADLLSSTLNGSSLVLNDSFETAGGGGSDVFANWTENVSDGAIVRSSVSPKFGTYSCQLTSGVLKTTYVLSTAMSVTALDYMSLNFWTRSSDTLDTKKIRYIVYDVTHATNIVPPTEADGVAGDTTWVQTRKGFQVPSGCTSVRVYFYCPEFSTDSGFVDYCRLTKGVEIETKHDEMEEGDICYSEANLSVEFFFVLSTAIGASAPFTYWVDRNIDFSGYNNWYAGDAIFNTGTVDEGFIDLYSIHGVKAGTEYGPTIVGNVRNTDYFNDWTPHWAIGNLNGIYGEGVTTYGIGLGDYDNGNYLKYTSDDGLLTMSTADGFVTLDTDGLTIFITDSWQTRSGVTFVLGSTEFAALEVRNPIGINDVRLEARAITGANTYAGISSFAPASKFAISFLGATYTAGYSVFLELFADSVASYATLDMSGPGSLAIYGGLYVGTTGGNNIPAGQIHSTEQIRTGGGLVVGSIGVGAIDGYAIIANGLYVGSLTNPTNDDIRATADIVAGGGLGTGNVDLNPQTYAVTMRERTTDAATVAGYGSIYAKNNGMLQYRNDSNVTIKVTGLMPLLLQAAQDIAAKGFTAYRNYHNSYFMRDGNYDGLRWHFNVPPGWAGKTINVIFHWTQTAGGSGNVRFAAELSRHQHGGLISTTVSAAWAVTSAIPVTNYSKKVTLAINFSTLSEGDGLALGLIRYGPDGADTYTNDAILLSVSLEVV